MKWLKEYSFYNGTKDGKTVSVTELGGDDVLQMALRRLHEVKREDKISQATLGSIFDMGMRQVANESGIVSLSRKRKTFGEWTISGEGDLFDEELNIIYDVKLSKIYALEMFRKDPKNHQYTKQLNWYRYLYDNPTAELRLLWFLKDQSDVNEKHPKEALVCEDVPYIDKEVLLAEAKEKIIQLEFMLENGVHGKCKDTWSNDMRCKSYCDCKSVCPHAEARGYNRTTASW